MVVPYRGLPRQQQQQPPPNTTQPLQCRQANHTAGLDKASSAVSNKSIVQGHAARPGLVGGARSSAYNPDCNLEVPQLPPFATVDADSQHQQSKTSSPERDSVGSSSGSAGTVHPLKAGALPSGPDGKVSFKGAWWLDLAFQRSYEYGNRLYAYKNLALAKTR